MNKKKLIIILASILLANTSFGLLLSKLDGFEFNKAYALAASKLIYTLVIIYFCYKYKLLNFKLFRFDVYLILALLIGYLSYYQMNLLLIDETLVRNNKTHFDYIIRCLSTGFFEEILFRVFVFYGLLKLFNFKKLIHPIWIASLIFGMAHLSNIINPEIVSLSVLTQIVFAVFIGFFFQSILIYTRSYILVAVLHGAVNYFGMYKSYLFIREIDDTPYLISDLLTTIAVFGGVFILFLYPLSLRLIRSESKKFQANLIK